jgi:ABC-type dipeptide/oligopeptide/nickel transport system permease subunit
MEEMVGICQVMWFIMLESAMDQVLGVDTLGQHVPTRVWYGTACLLIENVVGSVPFSDEWAVVL